MTHSFCKSFPAAAASCFCCCAAYDVAGYSGQPTDELLDSLRITRYQSSKAALTFADYSSSCGGSRLGVADLQVLLANSGGSNGSSKSGSGRLQLAFTPN